MRRSTGSRRIRPPSPASLAAYGESDLLCYRSEGPQPLVRRQEEQWDRLLGWARQRYDVDFETIAGIMHRTQPPETIERLARAVAARDPFRLAGLVAPRHHLGLAGHRPCAGRGRDRPRTGLGRGHARRSVAGRAMGRGSARGRRRWRRGGASSTPPTASSPCCRPARPAPHRPAPPARPPHSRAAGTSVRSPARRGSATRSRR